MDGLDDVGLDEEQHDLARVGGQEAAEDPELLFERLGPELAERLAEIRPAPADRLADAQAADEAVGRA